MCARRLASVESYDWFDRSDQRDWLDSADPVLIDEPIENLDANEPTLPIDATDPTLPIDSTDPRDPIESTESVDHNDQRLPLFMTAIVAQWSEEAAAGGDETVGVFFGGRVVVGAGLHQRIGPGGVEIGYWVHRACTRGFATSVARAHQPRVHDAARRRVEIEHDAANMASAGVPARLGFRRVGEESREPEAPAETGVHVVWPVTREEWAAANPT